MYEKQNCSRWDFIYEILSFLGQHTDVVRSKIGQHIGLTSPYAKKHLTLLQDLGCMTMANGHRGSQTTYVYNVTDKGLELRDKIKRVYDMFGGERPKW